MAWVLVTGASDGIGRELAILAAQSGRDVVVTGRRRDRLEALARDLERAHGVETLVSVGDLAVPGDVERVWAEAAEGRRIEILVNNAGLGRHGPFAEGDWQRDAETIAVNIVAATHLARLAIPHMIAHGGGRILNVGSLAGRLPGPRMAVYHGTKAYMRSFSAALAQELSGTGITVTELAPGSTETGFQAAAGMKGARVTMPFFTATARQAARAGWKATLAGRRHVYSGPMAAATGLAQRVLPQRLSAVIAETLLAKRG